MISDRQAIFTLALLAVVAIAGGILLTVYPRQDIRVYYIAAADLDTPTELPQGMMPDPESAGPTSENVSWQVPTEWERAPDRSMVLAVYTVPGPEGYGPAEMTVSSFPGDTGGDLANVNRWRGQLSLEPLDRSSLATTMQRIDTPVGQVKRIDLNGDSGATLAFWLMDPHGASWFFKLSGPAETIAAQSDAFYDIAQTLAFAHDHSGDAEGQP